jgi:molybdopterin-guanine dinucleotide biosynthesis protein MobB
LDLILVEGFKYEHYPKIELFRAGHSETPLVTSDPDIIAVATDTQQEFGDKITSLDLNNSEQIFQFIIQYFDISKN